MSRLSLKGPSKEGGSESFPLGLLVEGIREGMKFITHYTLNAKPLNFKV